MMLEQCTLAKKILMADRVKDKSISNQPQLLEAINNIRGSVMIAYPAYHGLPDYEATKVILEDKIDFNFHKHNDYDVTSKYFPYKLVLWKRR